MISAEIEQNNIKVQELAEEQGLKVAQMSLRGLLASLSGRSGSRWREGVSESVARASSTSRYLAVLATERCAQPRLNLHRVVKAQNDK